jgi:hypothetical protein
VGDPVAQVHQGGQSPVDEHQPMPGTGLDRPLPRPIGPPRVPARSQFGDPRSQDLPGQSAHTAIGDRGGPGQHPRHTTTLPVLHSSTVKPSGWPRMRSVDLNLQGFTIHSLTVDGEAAS